MNNDINTDINTDINNLCNGVDVAKEARIGKDVDLFPCNNANRTCNKVSNNNNIKLDNVNNIKLDNVNNIKLNKLVMLN